MDNQTISSLCTFGFVACVSYYLYTLFGGSKNDQKIRSRLKKNETSAAGAAPLAAAAPFWTRMGQAAAKPFMPTQREKIFNTRRNLGYAGIYSPSAVKTLYGFKFICLCLGFVVGYLASTVTGAPMLCLPAGALIGLYAPMFWLKSAMKKNQRELEYGLADGLDLMVICVEAGLTIDSAMQRVGQEMADIHPALSRELGIAHMETRVGVSRSESLRNMGTRTGSAPLQSLAAMLTQAERFGTSVGQALRVHAETLRIERQHRAEEIAGKTTVKLSFPLVLFIFPATFLILMGPTAIHLLNSPLFK
jgi:tight adherence protein C